MLRKIAASALLLSACWGISVPALPASAHTEMMMYGRSAPDGLRLPASIELLENTPYYSEPNPDGEAEGVFAPQTVKVLLADLSWSVGAAGWEIETMFGPKWIYPKPWDIDVPPPEHITLLADTKLYRTKSEKGTPAAVLAPQEVQVTGAEKQWFYTNDPSAPAWIKIHTTWMGDLWAHIPVERIGTVQETEKAKAHFTGLLQGTEIAQLKGYAPYPDGGLPAVTGDFAITGEYTTIYDHLYRVESDAGITWSREPGTRILETDESLTIRTETPLLDDVWTDPKEVALLTDEKVTVFEKVEDRIYGTNYANPLNGMDGPWYHVRTSKGTGWINPRYAEPSGAVPVHWKVYASDQREIYRYPGVSYTTSTLLLRNGTAEADLAWDQPNGSKWVHVTVEGHSGWLPLWNPMNDRIWDLDVPTAAYLTVNHQSPVWIERKDDGRLEMYGGETVGFVENGTEYWHAGSSIINWLGFSEEKAEDGRSVTYNGGDYAFRLKEGSDTADILWKGTLDRTVKLVQAPLRKNGSWYLNGEDYRSLFGYNALVLQSGGNYLFDYHYASGADGELPRTADTGKMELQVILHDWNFNNSQGGLPYTLSIEEDGGDGGSRAASKEIPMLLNTEAPKDNPVTLMQIRTTRELTPGNHKLTGVLRIGERILWKKDWTVTVKE